MQLARTLIGTLGSVGALVGTSYVVEALRSPPTRPEKTAFVPEIPFDYVDVGGVKVRYIKTGSGPNLVLLHTLGTDLDLYEKIVGDLATRFTVYAFDYPGHGWSDIPKAAYAPEDFYGWTQGFLDELDIKEATLVGTSIGGTIALVLAARRNPRVARVVSINAYDDTPAGSIRRSSPTARAALTFSDVPIIGATMMRLRNRFISDRILAGGVATPRAFPDALAKELFEVGTRRGNYQAFLSLLAHERLWADARREYPNIEVPALVIYGDHDWAPLPERERTRSLIPHVVTETVADGGHFLSLDRPREVEHLIVRFAGR